MKNPGSFALVLFALLSPPVLALAQTPSPSPTADKAAQNLLAPETQHAIDKLARAALKTSNAPSLSIAVVQDGQLAYTAAYGMANRETHTAATSSMRYSIGSISKQFTAAAILLLTEEGKLSLDDKIARWLPELTRANNVSVRQILSMTAGYQDYWPQDYVMPMMLQPTTAQQILDGWARKPLDFEPGTKWQYSNTNYVLAGVIVERASGKPLFDFLRERIFAPLKMTTVLNSDLAELPSSEPMRYQRFGLGPPRPAPKEGAGWMFAAGELAMTATDLARWDISMIDQTILKPQSYREMETETLLQNGAGTRYGLGVAISLVDTRRLLSHGGEVSGFTAHNAVFPDDRAAIVVQTNLDASSATADLAKEIATLLFAPSHGEGPLAQAKKIFAGLQKGQVDRTLFTANANSYFSEQALKDLRTSLGPLGKPDSFKEAASGLRGGMSYHRYTVKCGAKTLEITTYTTGENKLEQYIVAAE